jgi:predicted HTH transcriptional regulator
MKISSKLKKSIVIDTPFYVIINKNGLFKKIYKTPQYTLVIEGQDKIKKLNFVTKGCFNLSRKKKKFQEILKSYKFKSPEKITTLILGVLKKSNNLLTTTQIAKITKTKRDTTTRKYLEKLCEEKIVKKIILRGGKSIYWGLNEKEYAPLTPAEKIIFMLKTFGPLTKTQLIQKTKFSHDTIEDWLVKLVKLNRISWKFGGIINGGRYKIWRLVD